jgi:hypothetical protein
MLRQRVQFLESLVELEKQKISLPAIEEQKIMLPRKRAIRFED